MMIKGKNLVWYSKHKSDCIEFIYIISPLNHVLVSFIIALIDTYLQSMI